MYKNRTAINAIKPSFHTEEYQVLQNKVFQKYAYPTNQLIAGSAGLLMDLDGGTEFSMRAVHFLSNLQAWQNQSPLNEVESRSLAAYRIHQFVQQEKAIDLNLSGLDLSSLPQDFAFLAKICSDRKLLRNCGAIDLRGNRFENMKDADLLDLQLTFFNRLIFDSFISNDRVSETKKIDNLSEIQIFDPVQFQQLNETVEVAVSNVEDARLLAATLQTSFLPMLNDLKAEMIDFRHAMLISLNQQSSVFEPALNKLNRSLKKCGIYPLLKVPSIFSENKEIQDFSDFEEFKHHISKLDLLIEQSEIRAFTESTKQAIRSKAKWRLNDLNADLNFFSIYLETLSKLFFSERKFSDCIDKIEKFFLNLSENNQTSFPDFITIANLALQIQCAYDMHKKSVTSIDLVDQMESDYSLKDTINRWHDTYVILKREVFTIFQVIDLLKRLHPSDPLFSLRPEHQKIKYLGKIKRRLDSLPNDIALRHVLSYHANQNVRSLVNSSTNTNLNQSFNHLLENSFKVIADVSIVKFSSEAERLFGKKAFDLVAKKDGISQVNAYLLSGLDPNFKNDQGDTLLHVAARNGYHEMVQLLLNFNKIQLNEYNKEGKSPALIALENGNKQSARLLVAAGASFDAPIYPVKFEQGAVESSGRTWFLESVMNGDLKAAEFAQLLNTDILAKDNQGNIAIHLAARWADVPTLHYCMDVLAQDVDSKGYLGRTPFLCAAAGGRLDNLQLLVNRGADITVQDKHGNLAIHLAAQSGDIEILKFCYLSLNQNLESTNHQGQTPLLCAINFGQLECLEWLIGVGARKEVTDKMGNHPMHLAVKGGDIQTMHCCYEQINTNLNVVNAYESTPLHLAAEIGSPEKLKWLMQRGSYGGVSDVNGNLAIHLAARGGRIFNIQFCIDELNHNLHLLNHQGYSPLHSAAEGGCFEAFKWLSINGAELKKADQYGGLVVHQAALSGSVAILEHCHKELKMSLEHRNKLGQTPLFYAALGGQVEALKWLMEKGVNSKLKDKNGNLAIHMAACSYNHLAIKYCNQYMGHGFDVKNDQGAIPIFLAIERGILENVDYLIWESGFSQLKSELGQRAIERAKNYGHTHIVEHLSPFLNHL